MTLPPVLRTLSRWSSAPIAILTLALGIGLATAVYTVANAVLLRRLPIRDQEHVVLLWGSTPDGKFANVPLTLDDARTFARTTRTLSDVAFVEFRGATNVPFRIGSDVLQLRMAMVTGNFFDVLGARASLGRLFTTDDDVAGARLGVVLSNRIWTTRFGGDSAVIGKSVTMMPTGRDYVVFGVAPAGIEYPGATDVWVPAIAHASSGHFLDMLAFDLIARTRPGVTTNDVSAELSAFFTRAETAQGLRNARPAVQPLLETMLGSTRSAMLGITLAAALLLLIACVNVANLLLVRGLARSRELAVRSALGASRARLISGMLGESIVLASIASTLGAALAFWAVDTFLRLAPAGMARVDEVRIDWRILATAIALGVLTTMLSAIGPALYGASASALDALRSGTRSTSSALVRRASETLVVLQGCFAVSSLVLAALVGEGLYKLAHASLSFDPDRLMVVELATDVSRASTTETAQASIDVAARAVAALPGVRGITPVLSPPLVGDNGGIDGRVGLPAQSEAEVAAGPMLSLEVASPNYFAVVGTPVLRGRAFAETDSKGSTPVVIVSKSVAEHFWPNEDPIGKQLGRKDPATVVGVVPETRYRDVRTPRPTIYYPIAQSPFPLTPGVFLVRVADDPAGVLPAVRRRVAEVDPALRVVAASPMVDRFATSRAAPTRDAWVLAVFGVAAIMLAAIGLFAMMSALVRQREVEIGIRMALGATSRTVLRSLLERGLALSGVGVIAGVLGGIAGGRLLSSVLFEVSPVSPVALIGVVAFTTVVMVVVTSLPARAAARIDPAIALKAGS